MPVLATVLFATIIPPLVSDRLRFRQMQAALCTPHHVFWRSRVRFLRRSKLFEEASQHLNCQPHGQGYDDKSNQIHGRNA